MCWADEHPPPPLPSYSSAEAQAWMRVTAEDVWCSGRPGASSRTQDSGLKAACVVATVFLNSQTWPQFCFLLGREAVKYEKFCRPTEGLSNLRGLLERLRVVQ